MVVASCSSSKEDVYHFLSEQKGLNWLQENSGDDEEESRVPEYVHDKDTLSFFGKEAHLSLLTTSRRNFFKIIKKNIFSLRAVIGKNGGLYDGRLTQFESCRRDVENFFTFAFNTMRKKNIFKSISRNVIEEFNLLLKSIGTLSKNAQVIGYRNINIGNTKEFHLYHLYLETYQYYAVFLGRSMKISEQYEIGICEECFTGILKDLIQLSYQYWFNNRFHLDWRSILICSCTKSLWIALIHLFAFIKKPFWSVFSEIMCNIRSTQKDYTNPLDNFDEFKLLMVTAAARLFWIDTHGRNSYKENAYVHGNWLLIQELLQKVIHENTDDSWIQNVLLSCIELLKHWNVSLDVFNLIWDFFNKAMNKPLQGNSRQAFKDFVKLECDIMKKFHECCAFIEAPFIKENKKSTLFELFLTFTVVSMKRAVDLKNEQFSSAVKGRVYSKFHKRRMEELENNGIDRFIYLFSTLSLVSKTDDTVRKMFSLLSLISTNKRDMAVKKHVLMGFMLSLLICKQKAFKCDFVIKKLDSIFLNIIEYVEKKPSSKQSQEQHHLCWELLSYYFESLEDCFEFRYLTSDEGMLFNENYKKLINFVPLNHLNMVSRHLKAVTNTVMNQTENPDIIIKQILENFCNPLEECLGRQDEVDGIMEILGMITIITVERNCPGVTLEELVNNYAFGSSIPFNGKCKYISVILTSPDILDNIEKINKNKELINIWINAVFMPQVSDPSVTLELTQKIIQISSIKKSLGIVSCLEVKEVWTVLISFIKELGKRFSNIESIIEKTELRKEVNFYLKDIVKLAEPIILKGDDESAIRMIINTCGHLVKHCSKLIYLKTQPSCLLPQILDLLILPLNTKKNLLSKTVANIVDQYLHMFLMGLSALDIRRDDFVGRKLREIHQKYIYESTLKASQNNPFLIAIKDDSSIQEGQSKQVCRLFTMEFVKDNMLMLPQAPQKLSSTLFFVREALKNEIADSEMKRYIEMFFTKLISCILVCQDVREKGMEEPPNIRKYSLDIIKRMASEEEEDEKKMLFQERLRKFVEKNLNNYKKAVLHTVQSLIDVIPTTLRAFQYELNSMMEKRTSYCTIDRDVEEELDYL